MFMALLLLLLFLFFLLFLSLGFFCADECIWKGGGTCSTAVVFFKAMFFKCKAALPKSLFKYWSLHGPRGTSN
jgi:hypothetical protein